MAWSLLNHQAADDVSALLDRHAETYGPDVARFYSREQALAIIHAALWGYAVRSESTAGAYAADAMFRALGLATWSFDPQDAPILQAAWRERAEKKRAETATPSSNGRS